LAAVQAGGDAGSLHAANLKFFNEIHLPSKKIFDGRRLAARCVITGVSN
jgi:hypothetical protein